MTFQSPGYRGAALTSICSFASLVALPHSVFALPFALAAFSLAFREGVTAPLRFSLLPTLLLIVVAVIFARTAALAFNRIVDAEIDARNVRTKGREIPSKRVSRAAAWRIVAFSGFAFLGASWLLGEHCFPLAPLVLAVLLGYSFTKRFTSLSHLFLGLALALAPGGAWWVLRPEIAIEPLLLMAGVLFWVAGFDILYSCQDAEFDRENRLFSVPARIGVPKALFLARLFHALSFVLFLSVGLAAGLSLTYFSGMVLLGAVLFFQHELISPEDLSRIDHAFFTANGFVSLAYFLLVIYS